MLVVLSSYLLTVGAQVCFQAVSGTGSTKTAFRLEIVALTIYICYCTVVIMMLRSDIAICWTSEHVYSLSVLLLSWFYLKSGRWKNRKV